MYTHTYIHTLVGLCQKHFAPISVSQETEGESVRVCMYVRERVWEKRGDKKRKKDEIKEEAKSSENVRVEDARARGRRDPKESEREDKKRRKLKNKMYERTLILSSFFKVVSPFDTLLYKYWHLSLDYYRRWWSIILLLLLLLLRNYYYYYDRKWLLLLLPFIIVIIITIYYCDDDHDYYYY